MGEGETSEIKAWRNLFSQEFIFTVQKPESEQIRHLGLFPRLGIQQFLSINLGLCATMAIAMAMESVS